jgi:hypothetical protein
MNINDIITESHHDCPHCGGPLVEYSDLMEKKDACYYKVKASAKVWPSAYASGRLVQCRKKGASNYGNKSEGVSEGVSEGIMSKIADKVMGAAPEQPKYKVGQRVKYETSLHQPNWKDGGSGVGVITDYKNGHYMINGNPVNHFDIKDVVEQGMAEGNLKEFAPVGGDDREPNEEEILRQLAAQWWNGTEQQMAKAQKTLASMGWEIGQDESGDDDAGVFVIRAGDINGNSYMAFNHSDLDLNEGVAEGSAADGSVNYTLGHTPDAEYVYSIYRDGKKEGTYHSVDQAREIMGNMKLTSPNREYKIKRGTRNKMAGPAGQLPEQGVAEAQLDEKCWDGYQQQGMKNKSGRQVPNCVPVEENTDPEIEEMYEAMNQLAEEIAAKQGVSVDLVWESFEALDDHMLFETAAWRRKEGKSAKGGLNAKGVASYRRENPGSKLQTAVTTKPSKLKKGSKAAKRRKSFCARMGGVKGPMKKPNGKPTRKALALRKWNC